MRNNLVILYYDFNIPDTEENFSNSVFLCLASSNSIGNVAPRGRVSNPPVTGQPRLHKKGPDTKGRKKTNPSTYFWSAFAADGAIRFSLIKASRSSAGSFQTISGASFLSPSYLVFPSGCWVRFRMTTRRTFPG